ncbi:Histidine phosphatase superfamily, clade-2-containing protein [Aphelenchoides besseyi]|nr:Histidine phosphatase superfamily, clade-2-containing protein [Aphelenchoides besseyi]
MFTTQILFFLAFANFAFSTPTLPLTLRHLQAIWRHGDRAPKRLPYPNDIYDETFWPYGWAQLTQLGVNQMTELGRFFSQQYGDSFINATYDRREIYIKSSDSERALVSAQSFVNGFLPTDEPNWQPIPIHGSPQTRRDPLLKPSDFDCPIYEEEAKRLNSVLFNSLQRKYRDLFVFLGNVTGYGPNITLKQVSGLNDINREIAHQLLQPAWVQTRWPQFGGNTTLELVTELKRIRRVSDFDKPELFRLRGGYLLGDWLRRAHQFVNGHLDGAEKMRLYSSHDGTLQSLLHAMGIADQQQIPYAACVIMEIHEDANREHYVKMLYRYNGEVHVKKLRGCDEFCPLPTFIRLLNRHAIYNKDLLHEACGLEYCTRDCVKTKKKTNKKQNKKKSTKRFASKLVNSIELPEEDLW